MHISRILLALVALPLSVNADDVKGDLQTARKAFAEAKSTAEKQLIAAMSAVIKSTAKSGDLKVLQTLISERDNYAKKGTLPGAKQFSGGVASFKSASAKAKAALRAAYANAIESSKNQQDSKEAARLESELAAVLSGKPVPASGPTVKVNKLEVDKLVQQAVSKPLAEFNAARIKAKQTLLDSIEKSIRVFAAAEKFDVVKALFQHKKALAEKGVIPPATAEGAAKLVAKYHQAVGAAELEFRKEVQKAATTAKRAKKFDLYNALLVALDDGFSKDGTRRWTTVFRSSDPRIWNTEHNSVKGFAIPVDTVPKDVKYLRLACAANNQVIILPVTKGALTKRMVGVSGHWGWCGGVREGKAAVMLGLYKGDRVMRDAPKHQKNWGRVGMAVQGRNTFLGCGFGVLLPNANTQGYTWAGQTLRPTVFTISVTNKPLTASEQKLLLK